MIRAQIGTLVLFAIGASSFASPPDWIFDQKRRVVAGDIVHWGSGHAKTLQGAMFRAENMAIRALVIECEIPHRNIIVRDRYSEKRRSGTYAWARASLAHEDCEVAQRSSEHQRVGLTSKRLTKDQELYQKILEDSLAAREKEKKPKIVVVEKEVVKEVPVVVEKEVIREVVVEREVEVPAKKTIRKNRKGPLFDRIFGRGAADRLNARLNKVGAQITGRPYPESEAAP